MLVLFFSFVGALIYVKNLPEPAPKTVIMATVALDASGLETELSAYDHQRASEHFANVILGWTVEPSFAQEFGTIPFTGRRQEKENLLFTLRSNDPDDLNRFLALIQLRLDEYNAASQTSYQLAPIRFSELEVHRSEFRLIGGVLFLSLLLTTFVLASYDWTTANRH